MALETRETEIEKTLDRALSTVEARIIVLIGELETKKGRIVSTRINIRRALNLRKDILKAMQPYNMAARNVSDFSFATKDVQKRLKGAGISSALTSVDKDIVTAFSDDTFFQLRAWGNRYASDINKAIYSGAITGTPVKDVVSDVRQLLIGGQDKAGQPLSSHAKTITVTGLRETDATLMQQKAVNDAGIKKFKYFGSLIKDSRDFCVKRAGKVFTLEQIKAWADIQFKGKKEGDPFVTRGGWNCRHQLSPVVD